MKYQIYANARRDIEHQGLIAACAYARTEAGNQPGVLFTVEREGRKVYKAQVSGGKLSTWML